MGGDGCDGDDDGVEAAEAMVRDHDRQKLDSALKTGKVPNALFTLM